MKTRLTTTLVASVLAISSLVAVAQTAPEAKPAASASAPNGTGGGMRMRERMDPDRMQAMMAKHHADLKAKLKLTPEQEGAWTSFTEAMKPPAKADTKQPDRAELAKLTTPERIDRMRALRNERTTAMNAAMDKREEAIKTFYAALNAEQKKTFDADHARMGMRHGDHQGMRSRMGSGAPAANKP